MNCLDSEIQKFREILEQWNIFRAHKSCPLRSYLGSHYSYCPQKYYNIWFSTWFPIVIILEMRESDIDSPTFI